MRKLFLASVLVSLVLIISAYALVPLGGVPTWIVPASGRPTTVGLAQALGWSLRQTGIIGNVSIINPYPLCPVMVYSNGSLVPAQGVTTEVVARSQSGVETFIHVSWFSVLNCVSLYGKFQASLAPGWYGLTLSYCTQTPPGPGCASLPTAVHVERGRLSSVSIGIDLVCNSEMGGCIWNISVTTSYFTRMTRPTY
jgi:hypothetical protein